MKVLYITLRPINMNTSSMIRNNSLIHGLLLNNCEVVMATVPDMTSNQYYDTSLNWDNGIEVVELGSNNLYNRLVSNNTNGKKKIKKQILKFLRIAFHKLSLFDNTIKIAKRISISNVPQTYYDLVISSSDPKSSHIATHRLIKQGLKYGKWIQYWGDPLTIDITNKTFYPDWFIRTIEENILRVADRVVYVSPFTLEEQKKIFPKLTNKFAYIPTPYPEFGDEFNNSNHRKSKYIRIGYFGSYNSKYRDILPLYEVARDNQNEIGLIIAGDSDLVLDSLNNVQIKSRISQKEVKQLESACDILVCIFNRTGTQIPGKLFHYAGTKKPVLLIVDSQSINKVEEEFEKYKRYFICKNSKECIERAIFEISKAKLDYNPLVDFSPKVIASQFLGL